MRRLLLVVAVLTLAAAPAGATGGYAPPQRVAACAGAALVTATADGGVWGVNGCGDALSLVHRTPAGSWSTRPLPFRGSPRAVADDGRTTFFLFASPYDPAGNSLSIAKVPHGGAPSAARVLQSFSDDSVHASLAARDGRWWAVWDSTFYGPERQTVTTSLHQARTIEPAFSDRTIDLGTTRDWLPHLALRGSGAVLIAHRSAADGEPPGVRPVLAVAGPDGRFVQRDLGVPLVGPTEVTDLLVAGGRTLLTLADTATARLAQDAGDLSFTTRTVPTRARTYAVQLAASYGRVFVAHSESFQSSAGAFTSRVYVAEAGATGPFTTTEVSAPLARTNPALYASLLSVTAVRGRATVLTAADRTTWSQTQR